MALLVVISAAGSVVDPVIEIDPVVNDDVPIEVSPASVVEVAPNAMFVEPIVRDELARVAPLPGGRMLVRLGMRLDVRILCQDHGRIEPELLAHSNHRRVCIPEPGKVRPKKLLIGWQRSNERDQVRQFSSFNDSRCDRILAHSIVWNIFGRRPATFDEDIPFFVRGESPIWLLDRLEFERELIRDCIDLWHVDIYLEYCDNLDDSVTSLTACSSDRSTSATSAPASTAETSGTAGSTSTSCTCAATAAAGATSASR